MAAENLARPSLSDAVTDRVLALIREQGLRPGQRLPSARALAERFSVATPTIREALRRLQATGAVELRHGSGVYVSDTLNRVLLPNPNLSVLPGERLLHLLDARLLIEPYLAERAAQVCDAEQATTLAALLDGAAGNLTGDDSRLHEANMGFHAAVGAVAGNTVLNEVLESLLAVHGHEQREILALFDDRARDHHEHREIMTAIVERRADDAAGKMRAHLADVRSVIARRLAAER
ncbi:FadR/GntR family transcriptional regulator [Actinocatenispora rupis]|uniref:GntR family transcriptional regulator n=1 Tax=Actinocatenispora rupis TaxID=519421 RepID=A0A8J3J043_9ACTN|nr:GntR family transcriptional regulator [Actinocatenispora rupis]GID09497.1 GntR family transcriptional regulator [Actinocatenispora rupis]